ncbi:transcription factor grauzone-like [Topomyia yanbarensis]|uniref:transcription factor grauzone-like n=1 Tax=Topomyia yanbarensis TaxID=2498891 RepID=UPI00273BEC9C|nr:transcription factor grauzone-like [Topomyia yanbarensis]
MTTIGLKNCFTCFRRTENFLCISEQDTVSGENVEAIFSKHFWFTKDDYKNRIVCTSCWEKIDEFHKFYCEVEKFHAPDMIVEVKLEPSDQSPEDALFMLEQDSMGKDYDKSAVAGEESQHAGSQLFVEAVYHSEEEKPLDVEGTNPKHKKSDKKSNNIEVKRDESSDDSDEDDDDDDGESDDADYKPIGQTNQSDSESESNVPLARRAIARRTGKKRPSPKKTERNDNFTCHKCVEARTDKGETFKSFYWLKQHFKKVHDSPCYIFCCNKKWPTTRSYNLHTTYHSGTKKNKTNSLRCLDCKRWFKDQGSFAHHMFLVHTPEEAKQFKCDRCLKAFADEEMLNSHVKWHDEVEQRNHHCPLCNRYFMGAGNLDNHNISHHSNIKAKESSTAVQNTAAENEDDDDDDSNPESTERATDKTPVKEGLEFPLRRKRGTPEDIAVQEALIRQFVSFNCTRCDFIGDSFTTLVSHCKKAHKTASGAVICCERRFGKRLRLYEHCLRHLNPDHFKCELCGKTFTDSYGLQHHNWWIHTPVSERPFKCDVCGDAFVKDYLLKQHMERHMEKERKTHTCDQCGRTYTTGQQLKTHMQTQHGAVSDWVCDACAKGFTHRALLEQHRLTHTEEGLASLRKQCEKCNRWLTNHRNYQRHKRRCFNNRGPVKCEVCGLVSVNETALRSHNRLHHSNRPKYACSFCGKEFKKQLRCKEHEANHTGDVLYRCPFCPRMCNSSSNMYTHKKTAHPEQWAEAVAAKYYKPPSTT